MSLELNLLGCTIDPQQLKERFNQKKNYLNLSLMNLEYIPINSIIKLNPLVLQLKGNNLCHLPEDIDKLTNLQHLRLNENKLTSLPESIGNLVNLKVLTLGSNQLKSLPIGLGNLINLEELSVTKNILKPLSEKMKQVLNDMVIRGCSVFGFNFSISQDTRQSLR